MLIRKLIEARRVDAEISPEIHAALVDSLFLPIASLVAGAVACTIVAGAAALEVGDPWDIAIAIAIGAVGSLRVASALLYARSKAGKRTIDAGFWERVYAYGGWAFSGLLGLLNWMLITPAVDATVQMALTTTLAGYTAGIAGRNSARPLIAIGQLTLAAFPMAIALLLYPHWLQKALGLVALLFVYGMIDIVLSLGNTIRHGLTMTRKEAALAARFAEQASRFDTALNNMSHGLCMLDHNDRLQVWNERFLELLHLQNTPVRAGMRLTQLIRHSILASSHANKTARQVAAELARGLRETSFDEFRASLDGEHIIAASRRTMQGGGSVVIFEDVTERERAQERIAHQASFDELTGLANRARFRERITGLLAASRDRDDALALHLVDLDRFKSINDTLGHPIGDMLLKAVASRLNTVVAATDMITRFGGDEFIVLQAGCKHKRDAEWLAQRMVRALKDPFDIDGHRLYIDASIGIAMAPDHGDDVEQLLQKADLALYAVKTGGRGGHRLFAGELEQATRARRALELDLSEALAAGQFELHFQPVVNLASGRVTACEALLRWTHPTRGAVPPAVFIPVAEEIGLIVALGEWVLKRACTEAMNWPRDIKVAVNLSPVQFRDYGLPLQVTTALGNSGLAPQRLELEVTERLLLDESDHTLATMRQLNDLGVHLSLDDFGSGYSALNYLRKFPFHKIKIDQSFIRDLGQDLGAYSIIGAITTLGTVLDKIVVAEGIETEEQRTLVLAQGCHEGQGYLFGLPMSAAALHARLDAQSKEQFVA
jgi:diguanylate cyclase (GGDEF)-like protein